MDAGNSAVEPDDGVRDGLGTDMCAAQIVTEKRSTWLDPAMLLATVAG